MQIIKLVMKSSFIAILCLNLGGCLFYSYHRVPVTVQDAETHAPISGATVKVWYPYMMTLNLPHPVSAATQTEGIASLDVANIMQKWQASAPGYIFYQKTMDGDPPRTMKLELYRQPAAHLTIIVPNGYRGPVKIDMSRAAQETHSPLGQREFAFHASATGYVSIEATPLLMTAEIVDTDASYENGQHISRADDRSDPSKTGFRYIKTDGSRALFVVGTEKDFQFVRSLVITVKEKPHHEESNFEGFQSLFNQHE